MERPNHVLIKASVTGAQGQWPKQQRLRKKDPDITDRCWFLPVVLLGVSQFDFRREQQDNHGESEASTFMTREAAVRRPILPTRRCARAYSSPM